MSLSSNVDNLEAEPILETQKFTQLPLIANFLQVVRYGITGGTSAFVNFITVVAIVTMFHCSPLLANVFGFMCGFVVSFFGHRFWTFKSNAFIRIALVQFLTISILNFSMNQSLFFLLYHHTHLHYTIALILTLGIVTLFTFTANKFWVFRR